MGMYEFKYLLSEAEAFTAAAYTTNGNTDVDFGVTTPNINKGGMFGLHVVVTTAFTGAAEGCYFWLIHGAATSPTEAAGRHSGMYVPTAQLIAGAHFYVSFSSMPLLRYVRGYFEPHTNDATAGAITAYLGPPAPPGG
jgi:hypothetical protein